MPMRPEIVLQNPCPPQMACVCSGQTMVNGNLEIPEPKPDIERIIEFNVAAELTDWQTIETPLGLKVIANGIIRIGIQYVGAVPSQTVHFAHWEIPWHTFFICEGDLVPSTGICGLTVCVEYADFTVIDPRHLSKTIVLFLCASPCPPPCPPCP